VVARKLKKLEYVMAKSVNKVILVGGRWPGC